MYFYKPYGQPIYKAQKRPNLISKINPTITIIRKLSKLIFLAIKGLQNKIIYNILATKSRKKIIPN